MTQHADSTEHGRPPIRFWANASIRDYAVLESARLVECPREVRVVGAARSRNHFVMVPLAEVSAISILEPRRLRLHILPWIGIRQFTIPQHPTPLDGGRVHVVRQFLDQVGVDVAYLHADVHGNADLDDDGTVARDPLTGRPLFHALDRTSPVTDPHGFQLLVTEAYNFLRDPETVDLTGDELTPPPLLVACVRALAAALDGASRLIAAARAPSGDRNEA